MIVELVLALAPQTFESDRYFRLQPGAGGAITISSKRTHANAAKAIRELSRLLRWRIQDSGELLVRLEPLSVDLAFTRRDPRTVATWIAAVGGVDVTFHQRRGDIVLALLDDAELGPEGLERRAIR